MKAADEKLDNKKIKLIIKYIESEISPERIIEEDKIKLEKAKNIVTTGKELHSMHEKIRINYLN